MADSKNPEKPEISQGEWVTKNPVTGEVVIHPQMLYEVAKSTGLFKVSNRGNIYYYNNGNYRLLRMSEFKAMIKDNLPVEYRNRKQWENVVEEFRTDHPDFDEDDLNNDENIINFYNGILDLRTGKLCPHDPSFLTTRQIPCEYNPNLTLNDAPVFHKYLAKLVDLFGEEMDFLLEYMGAILSNVKGWRFKKLLILVGPGQCGKTQLRELVMNLVGKENCISIDMAKINERFGPALLFRKRMAGSGDMAFVELSEVNIIKNLTGGDSMFAEFKGKDGFSFRYDGLLWFNANQLPYFRGDRGSHVYDRFVIVRCPNVIPVNERDPQILDKMLAEKEAIVSVAVSHLREALQRGYKFTESEGMMMERASYEIVNNSLLSFVSECCNLHDKRCRLKRSDFNRYYQQWCKNNFVRPERDHDIAQQLFDKYGIEARKHNGIYVYPMSIFPEIQAELDSGQTGRGKYD